MAGPESGPGVVGSAYVPLGANVATMATASWAFHASKYRCTMLSPDTTPPSSAECRPISLPKNGPTAFALDRRARVLKIGVTRLLRAKTYSDTSVFRRLTDFSSARTRRRAGHSSHPAPACPAAPSARSATCGNDCARRIRTDPAMGRPDARAKTGRHRSLRRGNRGHRHHGRLRVSLSPCQAHAAHGAPGSTANHRRQRATFG